jgi:hypothetical protein
VPLRQGVRPAGAGHVGVVRAAEHPIPAAFALAAKTTGVVFAPSVLKEPLLVGDVRGRQ